MSDLVELYQSIGLRGAYDSVFQKRDPVPKQPEPGPEDYNRGFMYRYFLQRKRPKDSLPFEINRNQFRYFEQPEQGISQSVYRGREIKWKLVGPKDTKTNSLGYPIRSGVRETNTNLVELYEEDLPGLSKILDDPLQYWRRR
jgi:hypothetical protein